ncbi:hypothetical protein CgunFtcFv8_018535 [Champsocephalus gunnari]|uniref:Secreted protein n=1 Tax=Champsocephalus gunnari TaxID=52237 RepID=A0AAN8GX58_CHAGU|nr:hypothetical protein CgunFtcFv8_018535 [Champsocephalus gunnari]
MHWLGGCMPVVCWQSGTSCVPTSVVAPHSPCCRATCTGTIQAKDGKILRWLGLAVWTGSDGHGNRTSRYS